MPFYFRKSKSFGPLRVNVSKSGIGTSFGVKGARLGANPGEMPLDGPIAAPAPKRTFGLGSMSAEQRARLYVWVNQNTAFPMMMLSGIFVLVIAAPFVVSIHGTAETVLRTVDWVIWACFAFELGVKTYLSPRRGRYLYTHWFEVLIVVVDARPLRIVRSLRLLKALEALRLGSVYMEVRMSAKAILSRHGLQYALLISGLLVVGAAAAETLFERAAGGTITDFGTGLWWAIGTVTAVGSAEVPKSPEGRGVAVLLMIVGIGLVSFLTANVAAYLVSSKDETKEVVTMQTVVAELRKLEERLDRLQKTVEQAGASPEDGEMLGSGIGSDGADSELACPGNGLLDGRFIVHPRHVDVAAASAGQQHAAALAYDRLDEHSETEISEFVHPFPLGETGGG